MAEDIENTDKEETENENQDSVDSEAQEFRETVDENTNETVEKTEEEVSEENEKNPEENKEEHVEEKQEESDEVKEPEKKPEKKEEKKPDEAPKSKKPMKTLAVIGIIVVLVIIAIIFYALLYNPSKSNTFEYSGFRFEKITFGGIYIYETNVTFLRDGKPVYYNVRLRNDPRKLGEILVNYTDIPEQVYFTFPEKTLNCSSDSLIASFQVGQYLGNLGFSVTPAVTENFTGNTIPVIDCSNATSYKGVVILKPYSEQNRIYQDSKGCVVLEAQECSVIEISERFILSLFEKISELQGI